MGVTVACPNCGAAREVDPSVIGRRARCPGCQSVFTLGGEAESPPSGPRPAVRAITCPACSGRFGIPGETVEGQEVGCPRCGHVVALRPDGEPIPRADVFPGDVAGEEGLDFDDDPGPGHGDPAEPEDFVAFLNAQRTTRAAPEPASPTSRYGSETTRVTVEADCVIRPFDCPEDATIGLAVTEKLREMLAKEDLFDGVVVSDSPRDWGRVVTVVDDDTTALVDPGGMLRYGSARIRVQATIHPAKGPSKPILAEGAMNAQRGMGMKAVLKAAVKATATKLGRGVVLEIGGYKRLKTEISGYATATCVFGVLGLIPVVGVLMFVLGLIPAILVFVYNRGRTERIGMRRTWTGLIVGGLASALWLSMFFYVSMNPR